MLFCFAQGKFAQSKKKRRVNKNSPAKVEAKAPEFKNGNKQPKPYKKVIEVVNKLNNKPRKRYKFQILNQVYLQKVSIN